MRNSIVVALALLITLPAVPQARRRAVRHPSRVVVVQPRTVVLTPSKDNTLFETNDGSRSNGAGIHVFTGLTAQQSRRRAVIAFDVSPIPPGSRVTRVSLTMRVSQTISGEQPTTLHALLADWGEGLSNAGSSGDGAGAPSRPNDATWLHRFFPNQRWVNAGGDFTASADATAMPSFGDATWESAAMTARVQQWVDQPSTNLGWIVIGNEDVVRSAKRFDSREVTGATKPSLTVEFTPAQ